MMMSVSNLLSNLEAQVGPTGTVAILFGIAALLGFLLGICLMGVAAASRRRRVLREAEEEQELLQNLLNDTRMRAAHLQSENEALSARTSNIEEREAQQAASELKHVKELRRLNTELKAAQMSLDAKEEALASKDNLLQEQEQAQLEADGQSHQEADALALQHAREQGLRQGRETGLREGIEQGRVEGREEGLARGREEGREEGLARGRKEAIRLGTDQGRQQGHSAKIAEPPTLIRRVRNIDEGSLSPAEAGIIPDDQIIPTLPEAELTANVEAYDLSDLEDLVNEDV